MTDSDDDRLREEQIAECIQLINTKAKDAERTEALRQEVLTHQREIEKIEFDAKKLWSIHEYLQMARDAKQAMVGFENEVAAKREIMVERREAIQELTKPVTDAYRDIQNTQGKEDSWVGDDGAQVTLKSLMTKDKGEADT